MPVEWGTAITAKKYRGCGIGSEGARMRNRLVSQRWEDKYYGLSTVKVNVTAWSWEKIGVKAFNFWEIPYTSYLTCTCTDCSERHGFSSCQFRRQPLASTPSALLDIYDRSKGIKPIDCTVLISNPEVAMEFEGNCRKLHTQLNGCGELKGEPLVSGEISISSMIRAADFFSKVREIVKNQYEK